MKNKTLWNYIIVIVSYALIYFLVDNFETRLVAISTSLGFALNFLRGRIAKPSYYILAVCITIFSLGVFVYIVTTQ